MEEKKNHYDDQAEDGSLHAVANGIGTEGGANRTLFKVFDGSRERAGAKNQREIVSLFLPEVSLDKTGIFNAILDDGRGIDAVLEDNGHLAADVLFREGAEAARGVRGKREIDLPLPGHLRIAVFLGAAQVATGDDRGAVEQIPILRR